MCFPLAKLATKESREIVPAITFYAATLSVDERFPFDLIPRRVCSSFSQQPIMNHYYVPVKSQGIDSRQNQRNTRVQQMYEFLISVKLCRYLAGKK